MGAGLRYYKKVFINARQNINPAISSSVSTPTKVISVIRIDIEVGHETGGYRQQQWPRAAQLSFLYQHQHLWDGTKLGWAWSLPAAGSVGIQAPSAQGPAAWTEEEEKKQGMLSPLLSTRGNAAQGLENNSNPVSRSISIRNFALTDFESSWWQKVAEHYRKQDLKYCHGIWGTLGKSASKVFVKCHLKKNHVTEISGCMKSWDLTKAAW